MREAWKNNFNELKTFMKKSGKNRKAVQKQTKKGSCEYVKRYKI